MVTITEDGVLFAKNSDREPNEAQHLDWHPAEDHAPGTRVRATWTELPQVAHTDAVVLSRPWWMFGAEMGANEHGVVIGNEAVFTKGPSEVEPGLIGMDLLRLGLERATTADGAVEVIVGLLEAYGQGGACSHTRPRFTYDNSFIVADPDGALVLETAGRSHAVEVVRSGARSISNGLTIPRFADAHADELRGRVAACAARRARTQAAASAADGVLDLMAALRDHGGPGGPGGMPHHSLLNGALDAPCAHAGGILTATQTTASWVADLRGGSRQHWATATSAPCTSIFKPVRVDRPTDLGPLPTDRDDPRTLWWRHERLHRAVLADPGALLPRFTHERDRIERRWVAEPPSTADAVAEGDVAEARWTADVVGAHQPDRRGRRLRRYWAKQDRLAGLDRRTDPDAWPGASGSSASPGSSAPRAWAQGASA
jgi:dipeptidase